jgi:hypothetical protein
MLSTSLRVAGLVVAGVLLGATTLASADRVPLPEPPRGRGDHCVEDTPLMRRSHMEFILHQRDLTVHEGIRTTKHSLKGCIGCHADQRPDGSYIPVDDPGQFCQSCHSYTAGVQMDCFECHATTPAPKP